MGQDSKNSAYLNAEQELILNKLIETAEEKTGLAFQHRRLGTLSKHPADGTGTIRIVVEALPQRDALERYADALEANGVEAEIKRIRDLVKDFDVKVYQHEMNQIKNGTQVAVPEQLESTQE